MSTICTALCIKGFKILVTWFKISTVQLYGKQTPRITFTGSLLGYRSKDT